MKITRIQAIPLGIPLKKPLLMGGRKYAFAEMVLVRLETTGRCLGIGEAPVAPYLTGETIASVLAAVEILSRTIVGKDARDIVALSTAMHEAIVGNSAAKTAVDIALHDAVAREYGIPIYRLLGGRTQDVFDCLTLVGNSDPVGDLAEVSARQADGFTAFKLKVANGDLADEATTLIEMRKMLGPNALISADANGGWSTGEATRFVKLVESASPDFVEQPVAAENQDGMMRVARASSVPMGADESIHNIADIRWLLASGAAQGGAFKVMKLGGITRCMEAVRLCRALGGEINLSGKLGESSVGNAATLSVAAAVGGVAWGLSLTNKHLVEDIVREPLAIERGQIRPIDRPGLGVEIDEAKVSRFEIHSAFSNSLRKEHEITAE